MGGGAKWVVVVVGAGVGGKMVVLRHFDVCRLCEGLHIYIILSEEQGICGEGRGKTREGNKMAGQITTLREIGTEKVCGEVVEGN